MKRVVVLLSLWLSASILGYADNAPTPQQPVANPNSTLTEDSSNNSQDTSNSQPIVDENDNSGSGDDPDTLADPDPEAGDDGIDSANPSNTPVDPS